MLEGYFTSSDGAEKQKRLLAVQAALEIIQASVSCTNAYTGRDKLSKDIDFTKDKVSELADAIQAALEK
ncbi:hypothetical protein [Vagococcus sp. WN89Y]|uniref:hypothetical protein n=1 Tax=Vagococcus sp. WN89Y TaxID=3457258 RepID=UPI003FCE87A9